MDQAWLHSLSEDWVSQPGSSGSPAPSLPSLSNSTSSNLSTSISRIPKYDPLKQSWTTNPEINDRPLAERSLSDNNIPKSQRIARRPSKLCDEITNPKSMRSRVLRRSSTTSASPSSQYHTMQHHKSVSLSPKKGSHETPDWKRRLLQGDVAYGEQRDLFSPAGLENIFRPPPPQPSPNKFNGQNFDEDSIMMPSSPPPYNNHRAAQNDPEVKVCLEEETTGDHNQPRVIKYKLMEDQNVFSSNDISCSSSFRPGGKPLQKEGHDISIPSDLPSNFESSVLQQGVPSNGAGRTASGQTDIRNEELSPILLTKYNPIDGKVDHAALYVSPAELHKRLETLQDETQSQLNMDSENNTSVAPVGDMTTNTDDFARNGHFINFRRGGHSQEGSFHRRPLSPSSLPAIDESALLPEESMQASTPKQLHNIRKNRASDEHPKAAVSPAPPRTPHPSPSKPEKTGPKTGSGSPLKLFGTYDTFTNQKLLRRLSQFEENFNGDSSDGLTSIPGGESTNHEANDAFVAPSSSAKPAHPHHERRYASRKVSNFGAGELDDFQFNEDVSYDSSMPDSEEEDKENLPLPSQSAFKFQLEPSPALEEVLTERRTRISNTTKTAKHSVRVRRTIRSGANGSEDESLLLYKALNGIQSQTNSSPDGSILSIGVRQSGHLATPRKQRNGDSEGKRLRNSPIKDPTPKRRRTLQTEDIAQAKWLEQVDETHSLRETHYQMQSVVGKKRKDARHDDDQQAANPKVLAMRQILRPRTPTPSQRSSQLREREHLAELEPSSTEHVRLSQEQKIAKIQAELDSAEPPRVSALGMSQKMQTDSRKGSVTTQDFLDEAKKIMAGIRGKTNRPRSGLTSVDESESENAQNSSNETGVANECVDDSYQESTMEPFSRPPSREGGPINRLPTKQQDPAVLDHLRKYEELSDMDGFVASSMKSVEMAKDAATYAKELDRITEETISRASGRIIITTATNVESDPPNIRISESIELQRKRKLSNSTAQSNGDEQQAPEFPSQGSNASSQATSVPTGSSRGSDSRRVIAPHTVSHLIPEQLAGMVFDRERNIWVKRKTSSGDEKLNSLPSDETDDDPFGDIPDLSVDETQELQRIKAVAAIKRQKEMAAKGGEAQRSVEVNDIDTQPGDGSVTPLVNADQNITDTPSFEPSRRLGFILPEVKNKSRSLAGEHTTIVEESQAVEAKHASQQSQKAAKVHIHEEHIVEEVEREIYIHEGRGNTSPKRRRNVTITFSSPIASIIQMPAEMSQYNSEESVEPDGDDDNQVGDVAEYNLGNDSVIITKRRASHKASSMKMRSSVRNTSSRLSLSGHKFSARPVSRIDERDEYSSDDNSDEQFRRSVSVVLASTPMPSRTVSTVLHATPRRPPHEIGTLELTPMSEFTMNQEDEHFGLEVSYIERGLRYVPGSDSKRTLSQTVRQLVERLTEIEAYEPHWEYIKQIDLRDKNVTSLHMLDEFCSHIIDLDVSKNELSHLNGVPQTVRHLRIAYNHLTELTAWGHLSNLQYVDISNNEIENLSGFAFLLHLRSLRADNNKIKSLDGISNLDGLLSLRLRGNQVESLDFRGTKLQRLSDLDLNNNHITSIQNIHELPSLSSLSLDGNRLEAFVIEESGKLPVLKYLKLSGNNIESIDVSHCPNLRLLYMDRNRLGNVTGLLNTKYLDSLSMREQQDGAILNPAFLDEAFEVRKLFLSGNLLQPFKAEAEFLNLQYLELANCGLESLPADFGQRFRNLRVLNLNSNAFKDIKSLIGILRLKRLHLAGNRLPKVKPIVKILMQFPLALVDLRNNPATMGFYAPMTETRIVSPENVDAPDIRKERFVLGMADQVKDNRYSSRLDMGTKLLRRVYEKVVIGRCVRLKALDGLPVDKETIKSKDKIWEAMAKSGLEVTGASGKACPVRIEVTVPIELSASKGRKVSMEEVPDDISEIWGAEDSFA